MPSAVAGDRAQPPTVTSGRDAPAGTGQPAGRAIPTRIHASAACAVVAVRTVASCAVQVHARLFGHRTCGKTVGGGPPLTTATQALRLESDVMWQLAGGRRRWFGTAP